MPKPVRNVLGIIALVLSGFFLYGVDLIAFVNQPAWPIKTVIISICSIPAIVFFFVGVLCHGFDKIRRDLGVVLLSASGMSALVILSFVCMLASPETTKYLPPDTTRMFGAILSGIAFWSLCVLSGLGLLFMGPRKNERDSDPVSLQSITGD